MGHTVVGRLLLGHTVRGDGFGWGRQVIIRTASEDASAGLLGQTPPRSQTDWGRCFEDVAGDVAFQTTHDFSRVQSFGASSGHIGPGLLMARHAGEYDAVESRVGVAVTAPVEPIAGDLAR